MFISSFLWVAIFLDVDAWTLSKGLAELSSRQRRSNNIIEFNPGKIALPHSASNFNPVSSSLSEAPKQRFRPVFLHRRRPVARVLFPNKNLLNPSESRQTAAIVFGSNPVPSNSAISFSNKPIVRPIIEAPDEDNVARGTGVEAPPLTEEAKRAPIVFGSGRIISNKPHINLAPAFPVEANPIKKGISITNKPGVGSNSNPISFGGSLSNKPRIEEISRNVTEEITIIQNNETDLIESIPVPPSSFPNCTLHNRQIWYNDTCHSLLEKHTCGDDEWKVLTEDLIPVCKVLPCPDNLLMFNGSCVDASDVTLCPRGQILYVDLLGEAACDCQTDYFYDSDKDECYTHHEQGSCEHSYYLEFDENENSICVPNPCVEDNSVQHNGECFEKNYSGYCEPQLLEPSASGTSADCINFIVTRTIFAAPTLRSCRRGSRRDRFRKCRSVFIVPTQTTMKATNGSCKITGFELDEEGNCKAAYKLFRKKSSD